jgi:hypothetical protein
LIPPLSAAQLLGNPLSPLKEGTLQKPQLSFISFDIKSPTGKGKICNIEGSKSKTKTTEPDPQRPG